MRKLREWILRTSGLFNKGQKDRELQEELETHIQMHTEDNLRSGMTPEEARRQAMIQLGGIESTKEAYREQRGVRWLENLVQDVRFGARQLRKNPGFTAVAVLTLALGIGANTVMFSVAKAILFRPLGMEAPEQVVWLSLADQKTGKTGERFSWMDFADLRSETKTFEQVALIAWPGVTWEEGDRAEELRSLFVMPSIFDVLRVRPVLGRPLVASDAEPSAAPVALVSHELWQTRLAGNSSILGQTLRLNGKLRTVVGVLPPRLEFPPGLAPAAGNGASIHAGVQDVWLPLTVAGEDRTERAHRGCSMIGRLRPGVSVSTARVELESLGKRWAAAFPDTNRGLTIEPTMYRDKALGSTRKGIYVLAAAVVAVLFVCCLNLANLLLARGIARQRELAVRQALGAGRGRMLWILLTENALLSLLGGIPGIALAVNAVRLIRSFGPAEVPFIREVAVDGTVLGLTVALCFATALMFGFLPALWQSRIEAVEVLKSGIRSTTGPRIRTWQQGLLIGQIALELVLLSSAGLLLESFRRLMDVDPGYQSSEVIALDLGNWPVPTNADIVRLYREPNPGWRRFQASKPWA